MDWSEVEHHIRGGENERVELKRWEAFPGKVADAICALANTDGGVIVLGVADDGALVGVPEDPERAQERMTSLLATGLNVPVRATLGRHESPQGWIHWLGVRRFRGPEPLKVRGKYLVRRGRASVEASAQELRELFNRFGYVLTEEQVVLGASIESLDLNVFRSFLERQGLETVEEPQPGLEHDLLNRGIVAEDDGKLIPTLYGLLCFGRDPQGVPPTSNAWIECVAYRGGDRADDVILTGRAMGRLDEQVERAMGWVKALGSTEHYGELERVDRPLIPVRALREALVNAVAHRDYAIVGSKVLFEVFSDRVVVTSPGELPNCLREESALAGGHPRSRNELMANFLQVRGLMEKRGRGLPIIRKEMLAFNGTEPSLRSDRIERYVRLTLWRAAPSGAVGTYGTSSGAL